MCSVPKAHEQYVCQCTYLTPIKDPITSIFFCICPYSLQVTETEFKRSFKKPFQKLQFLSWIPSSRNKVDFIPCRHGLSERIVRHHEIGECNSSHKQGVERDDKSVQPHRSMRSHFPIPACGRRCNASTDINRSASTYTVHLRQQMADKTNPLHRLNPDQEAL